MKKKNSAISIYELCLYPMLGALMFCSKVIMEVLPNIHMLGLLTMVYTVVFRRRALIPIYIYVFLNGLYAGFNMWWVPYLYILTILWGITMLLKEEKSPVIWAFISGFFGLFFGTLCSVPYFITGGVHMGLSWIIAGLQMDIIHGIGNFFVALVLFQPLRTAFYNVYHLFYEN
jgi:energy-coupling factor transport system substrate-specific component